MQAHLTAKYVTSYFKAIDFEAKEGRPASHWEAYRLVVHDPDAFMEKDAFFIISVPMEMARKIGMDKATFEKENLGKVLSMDGILSTKKGDTVFTVSKFV